MIGKIVLSAQMHLEAGHAIVEAMDRGQQLVELLVGHRERSTPMACRCQERRAAIQQAARAKTVRAATEALRFTAKTSAEDLRRMLTRKARQA